MAARQANALSHQVSGCPGHGALSKCLPGPRPPSGVSSAPSTSCLQAVEHVTAFASPGVCIWYVSERQQGQAVAVTVAFGVGHACEFAGGQVGFVWRPESGMWAQEGLAAAWSWLLNHLSIYPSIHPASPEGVYVGRPMWIRRGQYPRQRDLCEQPSRGWT